MKEYDIVIEGEHISYESRHLRFGELQKDCYNENVDNCADFDDGDFGKWFRLDKATVYVQEYDDVGDCEIISYLYKEGQYVDNGFASEVISDLRPEAPVCMRIAVRDCAAWGEFDDEKFDPEQLKIIKAQKNWSDGEKRECIVGFKYRDHEIIIMDETDVESYDYFLSLGDKMIKISEGSDGIRTALDKLDEFNSSVYAKEYVEFKDVNGNIRGFFKLGFLVNDDGMSDVICVAQEECSENNGRYDSPMYRCCRVQEWNVRYTSEIQSDEKGEFIEFDPDSKSVSVIEKTEFFYSLKDDKVYEKSEGDKFTAPIALKQYDRTKAMFAIIEGRADKDTCLKMLWDLDSHNWIRKSNVSNECLINIWLSNDVSTGWKFRTLKDLSDPKNNSPVLTIPFEFEEFFLEKSIELCEGEKNLLSGESLPVCAVRSGFIFEEDSQLASNDVLWLLHDGKFSELDELALNGKLAKLSDREWNEIVLCIMSLANYELNGGLREKRADNLKAALSWLDRYKPGFLVKVKDAYGNNMAMYYAFAGMLSTVKTTQEGSSYEMARGVLNIIENFGVDVCQVNQFGVSAQMVYGRLMDSVDKS